MGTEWATKRMQVAGRGCCSGNSSRGVQPTPHNGVTLTESNPREDEDAEDAHHDLGQGPGIVANDVGGLAGEGEVLPLPGKVVAQQVDVAYIPAQPAAARDVVARWVVVWSWVAWRRSLQGLCTKGPARHAGRAVLPQVGRQQPAEACAY